ncbi:tRNA pseudouridine(55) synthase TruB [Patescibacteria group bacterium]|nr:tRNA pseudouridine(55) synthase TruB [Patescibacteria group bacterium]
MSHYSAHNSNHNPAHNSRAYRVLDGILVINKPKDWTSFDVVAKIRNKLNVKKIGHTGTLDPQATGVLVLCIGKGTKLCQKLTGLDKEYFCDITLGATSTTDDSEGEITKISDATEVPITTIEEILEEFTGTFEQMPPDFSAKKIKGKKAYEIARKGEKPELKPAEVTIHQIELLDYKWPVLKLKIHCGKGFYVRSLARDIGEKLGVGGYLTALQRTRVGHFSLDGAIGIEEADEKRVLPMSAAKV